MKFIVSSSYLLKQLQVLGSVINSSNTLPILDNFLFELDQNQLTVSASDLETTMSATLKSILRVKEVWQYRQNCCWRF
jgi:DNA polymerase III subunit beta